MPALNGDGKGFPAGVTTVAALPLRWRSPRDLGRGEVAVDEHGELLVVEDAQQPLRHHLVQAATQRGQLQGGAMTTKAAPPTNQQPTTSQPKC